MAGNKKWSKNEKMKKKTQYEMKNDQNKRRKWPEKKKRETFGWKCENYEKDKLGPSVENREPMKKQLFYGNIIYEIGIGNGRMGGVGKFRI